MTEHTEDEVIEMGETPETVEPVEIGLLEVLGKAAEGGETKQKMLAQFNRVSGAPVSLISWVDPKALNNDDYIYVECYGSPFNDRIVGTVDKFEIKSEEEMDFLVTEGYLDEAAIDRITKKYPLVRQVNNIRKLMLKLCEVIGDESLLESEEFQEMFEMDDYIKEVLRVNKAKKQYYEETEGFEYVSNERMEQEFDATLEGGVRDAFGPREIGAANRIF